MRSDIDIGLASRTIEITPLTTSFGDGRWVEGKDCQCVATPPFYQRGEHSNSHEQHQQKGTVVYTWSGEKSPSLRATRTHVSTSPVEATVLQTTRAPADTADARGGRTYRREQTPPGGMLSKRRYGRGARSTITAQISGDMLIMGYPEDAVRES